MTQSQILEETAPGTDPDSGTDFVERARALAPLIESEAAAAEAQGKITEKVVEALKDSGLMWMLVPTEYGGGLNTAQATEVIEEVSRADGSTGWVLMANSFGNAVISGFLPEGGSRDLYAGPDKAIIAGMGAPVGKAVATDGGYIVQGKYRFGSGSHHATHIGFGLTLVNEQGEALDYLQAVVPREQVVFKGGWDVTGFVATGSQDFEIPEQFVDAKYVFSLQGAAVQKHAPFATGVVIGILGHAGVALGLTARALQEVAGSSRQRFRGGYPTPVDQYPVFLSEFAKIEAEYQAARAYTLETFAKIDEYAVREGAPSEELVARARQATTWTHDVLERVISKARLWSGSDAFRNPSGIGRAVRDAGVVTQHIFIDPITYVEAAPALLRSWQR
ncbi:acyl-CoA dehydrogenase family protein [Arthrobacter sp. I2-34]|uniref:Acyl-CoA dehydrogenase family protein n=1 Tax=Arthrobacter hankyongi TaxID=2904801 RepID=A0ABS9L3N4_9MICC|nr:acyl-CoA dehydrogenase family protein [Arthrobacter hankyongi]MCG2621216.1 acyl-CoA dehydrogenase family protein [Arthrobacter hankyongi]